MAHQGFVTHGRPLKSPFLKPETGCATRRILYSRYVTDLWVYIDVLNQLDLTVGAADFDQAYDSANHARLAFEHSRDELRKHCAEHGCDDQSSAAEA